MAPRAICDVLLSDLACALHEWHAPDPQLPLLPQSFLSWQGLVPPWFYECIPTYPHRMIGWLPPVAHGKGRKVVWEEWQCGGLVELFVREEDVGDGAVDERMRNAI